MAIFPEPIIEIQTDKNPLLMEEHSDNEQNHIINIRTQDDLTSSSSHDEHPTRMDLAEVESRNVSTFRRRGDNYGHPHRRRRSPLNSGLWISVELVVTISQIIASIVVLSLSRNENPQAPLFAWVVGYASGCVSMLPILYWRFRNRHRGSDWNSVTQASHQDAVSETATPYTAISVTQASDEESNRAAETSTRNVPIEVTFTRRFNGFVDHFKMALDCFFAVWFVVGNVWIFGGHSSPADAPKLYRLCIVFLTFSCIGYAMPFILCATICCCLPCIISVLGIREDFSQHRGATLESINALPTYKFKLGQSGNGNANHQEDPRASEGGILAAGTEKERVISGEDAVCCICLAKYADDEELRELPCIHIFHVDCVDKWLKINASCPLCKSEVGESSNSESPLAADSS